MNKYLSLLFTLCLFSLPMYAEKEQYVPSLFAKDKQAQDKVAMVMIHFGTTHSDTREKTIETLNERVREAFPEWDFYEAYSSRLVIKKLKKRGVMKQTPTEVFQALIRKGYKYVMVQTSNIIDGIEMEAIRKEIAEVQDHFTDIRLGHCLLYAPEDYLKVAEVLKQEIPYSGQVVAIGHGTYTSANAAYAMMDYAFKEVGLHNFHVGTIEGYPTFQETLKRVEATKDNKVLLIPLMFVAGEHAKNDIQGEWKELYENAGYKTEVLLKSLGEYSGILDVYVEHIKFAQAYKLYEIMEKKADYAQENN